MSISLARFKKSRVGLTIAVAGVVVSMMILKDDYYDGEDDGDDGGGDTESDYDPDEG